jgi:hypothetical protein
VLFLLFFIDFFCIWWLSWLAGKCSNGNIVEKNEREKVIESLAFTCHSREIQNWMPILAIKHADKISLQLHWARQFFSFPALPLESALREELERVIVRKWACISEHAAQNKSLLIATSPAGTLRVLATCASGQESKAPCTTWSATMHYLETQIPV